jgi:hypothetical protein
VPGRCVPAVITCINGTIDEEASADLQALPDVLSRLSACVIQKLAPAEEDVTALQRAAGLEIDGAEDEPA